MRRSRLPCVDDRRPIAAGLKVHSIYCGYYFWGRPSRDELWRDLREVFKQTESDFDPTSRPA